MKSFIFAHFSYIFTHFPFFSPFSRFPFISLSLFPLLSHFSWLHFRGVWDSGENCVRFVFRGGLPERSGEPLRLACLHRKLRVSRIQVHNFVSTVQTRNAAKSSLDGAKWLGLVSFPLAQAFVLSHTERVLIMRKTFKKGRFLIICLVGPLAFFLSKNDDSKMRGTKIFHLLGPCQQR